MKSPNFYALPWGFILGLYLIVSEHSYGFGLEGFSVYLLKFFVFGFFAITFIMWLGLVNGKRLSYNPTKRAAFMMVFVAVIVYGIYVFAHFKWIDADYQARNVQANIEHMVEEGWTEPEIEDKIAEMRFWISPLWLALSKSVFHLFMGLLLAFFFAWVIGDKSGGQRQISHA